MGTGSITSERVWRKTASETAPSSEAREVVVSEPPAIPLTDTGIDAAHDLRSGSVVVGQIAVSEPSPLPSKEPTGVPDLNQASRSPFPGQVAELISSVRQSLKRKWFWCALASSLCWTGWAFTAKIGSKEIPPATMEFISAFGFGLVSLGVIERKTATADKSRRGKLYAVMSGMLLALGGTSLYGAYRTGYNTSMITAVTSLYPVVTVLCAVGFLREKLNKLQILGLLFALAAMSILSL
jgi:bacterial/archaeal transporter family protein